MTPLWLKLIVIAGAIFAAGGLAAAVWTTLKFTRRRRFAPSNGSEWHGIQYAFLDGMTPWAKESARNHLLTYVAGVIYHIGIAAGFCALVVVLLGSIVTHNVSLVIECLTLAGAMAGIGLLIKRGVTLTLRAISTPDDVVSNVLVSIFLVLSTVVMQTTSIDNIYLTLSAVLLFYIPLGKIRHCLLFFCSRATFGQFFGRRGVLPHVAERLEESHAG